MKVSSRAISADAALLARFRAGPFQARVHSVFDRVINIHCADEDRLLTLACRSSDDAPCTLVVDIPSYASLGLCRGSSAASDGVNLDVGRELAIHLESAAPWTPVLPAWPSHAVPVRWARAFVDREGTGGGIKPRGGRRSDVEMEIARLLSTETAALHAAFLAGRLDEAYDHGSRLIGLGPGLTPAGDDYVVGLATVCAMPGGCAQEWRDLLVRVIEDNAHRTNLISRAVLTQAARGRVRESIVQFARAITTGSRPTMELRAKRLIGIGATSGTDIMLGMLAGMQLVHATQG